MPQGDWTDVTFGGKKPEDVIHGIFATVDAGFRAMVILFWVAVLGGLGTLAGVIALVVWLCR